MTRELIVSDALEYLASHDDHGAIVTSLPDADETGMTLAEWRDWFNVALRACITSAAPDAPAIFYQTDRKADGAWHSKAAMVLAAAEAEGRKVLWHKIALRRDPGAVDLHRPGFTHLIAVSLQGKPGRPTPDVFERGATLYPNGMGLRAARTAVEFALQHSRIITDPFCGRGTIPAVAEALGAERAVGVDILPEQIVAAQGLKLKAAREPRR